MALDYISIPGKSQFISIFIVLIATSTAVEHVFSQGQQLLYFTWNHLSPALIWSSLCFDDWSWKELVCILDIIGSISGKGKGKRALEESLSGDED